MTTRDGGSRPRGPRIVLVVNRFPTLSEAFLVQKALALLERGALLHVLAQEGGSDAARFPATARGVPVTRSLLGGGVVRGALRTAAACLRHPWSSLATWVRALRVHGPGRRALHAWLQALPLVNLAPNVVHFELSGIAVSYADTLPLLRAAGAKLVVSARGSAEKVTPLFKPDRATRLRAVLSAVDRVHCVSQDLAAELCCLGLEAGALRVVRPGVDPAFFTRTEPYRTGASAPFRIVVVSRLHWIKALDQAVVVLSRLQSDGIDACLELWGDGPERDRLHTLARVLRLEERVMFHGVVDRTSVKTALEAASVFLVTSLSEGISNAALEAMAMEVPVVSTAVGGMPEAIRDGVEGHLVGWGDTERLVACVRQLALDPLAAAAMGQAGRRRVLDDFTRQRQTDAFWALYEELV